MRICVNKIRHCINEKCLPLSMAKFVLLTLTCDFRQKCSCDGLNW